MIFVEANMEDSEGPGEPLLVHQIPEAPIGTFLISSKTIVLLLRFCAQNGEWLMYAPPMGICGAQWIPGLLLPPWTYIPELLPWIPASLLCVLIDCFKFGPIYN